MTSYVVTDLAEQDITEIAAFISQDKVNAAIRFVDRLHDTFQLIAENPGIGPRREALATGLRSFPVGDYLVFYRKRAEVVEIIRVLSGFRDLDALLRNYP